MGKSILGGITSPLHRGRWQSSPWWLLVPVVTVIELFWQGGSRIRGVSLHIQLLRTTGLLLWRTGKDGWEVAKIWPPCHLEVLCFQSSALGQTGESSVSLPPIHESKFRRKLSLGCFPGHQPALAFLSSSDSSSCCHFSGGLLEKGRVGSRCGCRI